MSSTRKPRSYGEVLAESRKNIAAARLADPGEHFPYKADVVRSLIDDNPPMGPDGEDDDRLRVEDYMTSEIAEASGAYIEAQAALLDDPGDGTKAAYESAKAALVAARQAHRVNRGNGNVVGIRSRRAGE